MPRRPRIRRRRNRPARGLHRADGRQPPPPGGSGGDDSFDVAIDAYPLDVVLGLGAESTVAATLRPRVVELSERAKASGCLGHRFAVAEGQGGESKSVMDNLFGETRSS